MAGLRPAVIQNSKSKIQNQTTKKPKDDKMPKIKIRPLDDRVVVEPVEAEERTAGGIVLPDTAKEKPQRGKVLAVGPGKLLDSGKRGELSVAVGDQVIYGKYGGTDIEVSGDDVKILRESDILAKVVD
jgi:chaperonin GroES